MLCNIYEAHMSPAEVQRYGLELEAHACFSVYTGIRWPGFVWESDPHTIEKEGLGKLAWVEVVSCPDPTLSRGKGSGDHWAVSWSVYFIANELIWGEAKFFPPRHQLRCNIMINKENVSSKHQHMPSCTTFVMTFHILEFFNYYFDIVLQQE